MPTGETAQLSGCILAFDFGLKRIGVAVGNTMLRQAQALSIISAASNDRRSEEDCMGFFRLFEIFFQRFHAR